MPGTDGADPQREILDPAIGDEQLREHTRDLAARLSLLEAEHRRYVELFERAPIAYVETDRDGTITGANGTAADLLHVAPERLTGKALALFIAEEDRSAFRVQLALLQDGQELRAHDLRIAPRDGTPIVCSATVTPARDERGEVAGLRILLRDVTEERRMEQQIREREDRLRFLVERVPAILWTVEGDLTITSSVGGGLAALGLRPGELVGTNLTATLSDDSDTFPLEAHRRAIGGERVTYEIEWRGRPYQVYLAPLGDAGAGCVGIAIDISERKDGEMELQRALEHERARVARHEQLAGWKDTLVSSVAHDLRNALSVVLGTARTFERLPGAPGGPHEELFRSLVRNAKKMGRILDDMLDLDRLDRGAIGCERRTTDVGDLLRRVVADSAAAGQASVEVGRIVAAIDPKKVERIVDNLLLNAVRHTPPGTQIWVRAQARGDGLLLAVEDEGPGVPADQRARIFDVFATGETAGGHGVGLGLSIVKRFAHLHGGHAWVEERRGGGASFRVSFPASVRPD